MTTLAAVIAAAYADAERIAQTHGTFATITAIRLRAAAVAADPGLLGLEAAPQVRVKPLEWSPWMNGFSLHTETRLAAVSSAKSVLGTYHIGRKHEYVASTKPKQRAFDDKLSPSWWVERPGKSGLIGPFNGDVPAKAAAQADHDRRVRADLEPAPDHAPALAEALRNLLDDTQHADHVCGGAEWCPVVAAETALAAYKRASQTAPKTGRDDAQQTDSGGGAECT